MNFFVNEFQYTPEFINESVGAWWKRRFKRGYISMIVCILLIISVALLMRQPLYLCLEILPILVMMIMRQKTKLAVKLEKDRLEVVCKDTPMLCHVEIGEDILMSSSQSERHVSFSDVEDLFETNNMIVIMLKGSMTVPLAKSGFKAGDAENCLNYLKERCLLKL